MSGKGQALLFMAHCADRWSVRQFRKLVRQAGDQAEIVWLWDDGSGLDGGPPTGIPVFRVGRDVGKELRYAGARPGIHPGQQVMAVISFAKAFPDYRYYWFVEYDVWCRDWRHLLEAAAVVDADLLAIHMTEYRRCPAWYWWGRMQGELATLDRRFLRKAFFPLYRISARALGVLDRAYRAGGWVHHEIFVPTLLGRNGMRMMDLRSLAQATGRARPWYTGTISDNGQMSSGSFRYRPAFLPLRLVLGRQAELYHPVKPWSWWLREGRLVKAVARALGPGRLVSRLPLLWRLAVSRHRE